MYTNSVCPKMCLLIFYSQISARCTSHGHGQLKPCINLETWTVIVFSRFRFSFSLCFYQVTSPSTDPNLGFTIISCYISPNSNPSISSDYTLIETVCPTDHSVALYPQTEFSVPRTRKEKKSFSFNFDSKLNMSLLFLHCEMSLCSKSLKNIKTLPSVNFY